MNAVTSVDFHGVDADITHQAAEAGSCSGGRVSQFLVFTAGGIIPMTQLDTPPVDLLFERGKVTIVTEDAVPISREVLPERGSRVEQLPPEGTSARFVMQRLLMRCAGCGEIFGLPAGYKYEPEQIVIPEA
jgi:hypothetical protein